MMNLEKLGLSSEDMLQRSQLESIIGGNGDASLEPGGGSGTCGYSGGGPITAPFCGISKETAMQLQMDHGGNWCCDSCSTTNYCGSGIGGVE